MNSKYKTFILAMILLSQVSMAMASNTIDGTQKSFSRGFESLLKSDGDDAEEWDIQIGRLIKTHPTNFLKTLKIYREKIKRLDALVGNFGPDFVDNLEAQKKEANSRITALQRAKSRSTDTSIIKLADECIAELQKFSNQLG